jgi:hypothetical protein
MLSANSGSGETVNSGTTSSVGGLVTELARTDINVGSGVGLGLIVGVRVGSEVWVSLIVLD